MFNSVKTHQNIVNLKSLDKGHHNLTPLPQYGFLVEFPITIREKMMKERFKGLKGYKTLNERFSEGEKRKWN